ncbi:MAG TPA: dephospho-CoA kinase [Candidatus Omnitrophota bacterium]|nr:dephospho-CoA kinase [Candidatus Omnitrophota bacterium]
MGKELAIFGKVIGLTGPIASGKSEVARIMARRGAHIIEADEIGHKLLLPRTEVWSRVLGTFGPRILKPSGAIDRKKLGKLVFSDPGKLRKLGQIMHPAIKDLIEHALGKFRYRTVVINAALPQLFTGLADVTIVVTAPEKERLERLLKKGLTKEAAEKMIRSQMKLAGYRKLADIVISNDGTLRSLESKVKYLF